MYVPKYSVFIYILLVMLFHDRKENACTKIQFGALFFVGLVVVIYSVHK